MSRTENSGIWTANAGFYPCSGCAAGITHVCPKAVKVNVQLFAWSDPILVLAQEVERLRWENEQLRKLAHDALSLQKVLYIKADGMMTERQERLDEKAEQDGCRFHNSPDIGEMPFEHGA